MIGYELFLVSEPGEEWMVTKACPEHPDVLRKPFERLPGDVHPCTNGCVYEKVKEKVETPAQTFTFPAPPGKIHCRHCDGTGFMDDDTFGGAITRHT